jgi:hypothetical protein
MTSKQDKPGRGSQQNEGEGNKTAARHYNEATTQFAKSGKVDKAAKEAERAIDGPDKDKLSQAEKEGLKHSRH